MRWLKLIASFVFTLLTIWVAMLEVSSKDSNMVKLCVFLLPVFGICQLVSTIKKFYNKAL